MLMSEHDNLLKWNGREKPFFENYYLKLNVASLGVALWLRYTFMWPVAGAAEAGVWAIFFNRLLPEKNLSLKETAPLKSVIYRKKEFNINIGGAILKNDSASARIVQDGRSIEWDLQWEPAKKSFRHFPSLLYGIPWPPTKVMAPNLSVRCVGKFIVDGVTYDVNEMLTQGHAWGRDYAEEWAWANCISFIEDKKAVLELVARKNFGLGFLKWGDESCRFILNGTYNENSWDFSGRTFTKKIKGRISARDKEMTELLYKTPSGGGRICKNSCLASCRIEVSEIMSGKTIQNLTSESTTAFETVR